MAQDAFGPARTAVTSLPIPDVAGATDAEIEALFPSFDGRWSRLTRSLLTRFGAHRLDLDDNWASVPPTWACGACGRDKSNIARVSDAGVLLCRLDWHHDHLRDLGKRILRSTSDRPTEPDALRQWFGAIDLCKDLIERFHPAHVCIDCNAADGEAKARLKGMIHPDFSFSPSEIARFITANPNVPHRVDVEAARAIWLSVEDDVRDRIAFTELMARRVADGRHRRQGRPFWREEALGPVLRDRSRDPAYPVEALRRTPHLLSARSVRNDGFGTSLKTRSTRVRIPTRTEFDAYTAAQDPRSPWVWHDADWTCAACDRSRFECLRASGKGKWTGRLHRLYLYEDERNPQALRLREGWDGPGATYRSHSDVYLCQDCRLIITDANRGLEEPSEDSLRLADLRALVGQAAPHRRPETDGARALAMAEENLDHILAAAAYWRHRSAALAIGVEYDHLTRHLRVERVEAMQIVLQRMGRDDLDEVNMAEHLDFILQEGRRFSAESRA